MSKVNRGIQEFIKTRTNPANNGVTKMDVTSIDPADWLTFDMPKNLLNHKKQINKQYKEHTYSVVNKEAEEEFYRYTKNHMKKFHDKSLPNISQEHLYHLANHIDEDIILMTKGPMDNEYKMSAGSLVFPSGWALKDKMGLSIAGIHRDIPEFTISKKIENIISRIPPLQFFLRVNFLLSTSNEFAQHKYVPELYNYRNYNEDLFTPEKVGNLFLRNEREVVFKLPETKAIVFSIKTYITELKDLPGEAKLTLANYIEALPQKFSLEYKKLDERRLEVLLAYLRENA